VTGQRVWSDVAVGDELEPIAFPLTVYRMVMAAGANRDFNAIHHNTEYARSTGAPDMYANTLFLQGMWERCVRDYIGLAGSIRRLAGFRMRAFNTVGTTPIVRGRVTCTWIEDGTGVVEIEMQTVNNGEITVGPGTVTVTLPMEVDGR
jgi:acyl dehydratase